MIERISKMKENGKKNILITILILLGLLVIWLGLCLIANHVGINHLPGQWVVDRYPTEVTAGHRHIPCMMCGEVLYEQEMPALNETSVP